MARIAINGFGRIGRLILKIGIKQGIDIIAINDVAEPHVLAYLLKHDTLYGQYAESVSYGDDFLQVGKKKIKVFHELNPENLPWKSLKIDAVVESTGRFTKREEAQKHILAGAKRVFISAPAKNQDITLVPGVNLGSFKPSHAIISVGSCTTNCLAPVAKVLDDSFGIETAFMTTVHAYTNSQKILDLSDSKLRQARAAALNIIPSTTGATQSVVEVLPHLKGKLSGLALRVPVGCGSIVDLTAILTKKPASAAAVNDAFRKAAAGALKGIIAYSEEELVSSDIVGNSHSAIVDGLLTAVSGTMVKVLAWYDNEYGYSSRMVDVLKACA